MTNPVFREWHDGDFKKKKKKYIYITYTYSSVETCDIFSAITADQDGQEEANAE